MLQQIIIFCSAYILTGLSCATHDIRRLGPIPKEVAQLFNVALFILLWPFTILSSSNDDRFIAHIFLFVLVISVGEMIHYAW